MDVALPKSLQRTLDQAEEHVSMIETKWKEFQGSNNSKTSSDSNDSLVSSRNDSVRALAISVLLLTRKRLKGEETEEIEASVEKCKAGLLKMHSSSSDSSGKSSEKKKSVDKKTTAATATPRPNKPNTQSSNINNKTNNNNNNNNNKKKKKQKTKA